MTASTHHLSHPKYRPDIDGLRAIAVLPVVAFHAFPSHLKGGFIGVDIFFVISGFLISTIIFNSLNSGVFSFSEFYTRRVKRIFPSLSVVLLACLLLGYFVLLPDELNQLGKHVFAGAGFMSNLVLLGESGYFDNSAETKPLLHLWSLGIEEQFYIFWPFLLWVSWKIRANLLYLTVILLVASFAANMWMVYNNTVAAYYSPLTRAWELLCGTLLSWYLIKKSAKGSDGSSSSSYTATVSNVSAVIGLGLLAFGFFFISKGLRFPGYWALIPVIGSALIIMAGPNAWFNRHVLSHKLLVWFGLLSFPLYLWHWPMLSFCRIMYTNPSWKLRVVAVICSVCLAWLTVRFVERPLRFGVKNSAINVGALSGVLSSLALVGVIFSYSSFTGDVQSKIGMRKGGEHAVGASLSWYRGQGDWLFLGNAYDNTVAKLKLAETPNQDEINKVKESLSNIAEAGYKYGVKTALIVGPNKSSIYPEHLPKSITPSPTRYSGFFLKELKGIPNLTVYDPTNDLLAAKNSEGILYWMTDTHWNMKGAFLAYAGFAKLFNIQVPSVKFKRGMEHRGDLIGISKLKNFPLHSQDNWDVVWHDKPEWVEKEIPNEQATSFGVTSLVTNKKVLSNQYVWVVGDSFSGALRQYFNATFKQVRYVGHWSDKLNSIPYELEKSEKKPDLVIVVRVERSF